ncbi:MAG: hypothetical protein U0168_05490 [Nannocystaceae bacterium]
MLAGDREAARGVEHGDAVVLIAVEQQRRAVAMLDRVRRRGGDVGRDRGGGEIDDRDRAAGEVRRGDQQPGRGIDIDRAGVLERERIERRSAHGAVVAGPVEHGGAHPPSNTSANPRSS